VYAHPYAQVSPSQATTARETGATVGGLALPAVARSGTAARCIVRQGSPVLTESRGRYEWLISIAIVPQPFKIADGTVVEGCAEGLK
jgi:hypothetical protein